MTLQNGDFGPYTETFRIDPPSVSVSFPLRDGLASEKTGEPLPPGEYSRQMVVIAEDGDELQIRWGSPDVVTLAGSLNQFVTFLSGLCLLAGPRVDHFNATLLKAVHVSGGD